MFEYHRVNPDSGGATLGGEVRFSIPQFGDFFNDMALYVRFNQAVYTPVADDPNRDVFRYCDYPGERLLKKVKFDVNGNPLDEYTSTVYNFHRQFLVPTDKLTGWKRLVGQEVAEEAYLQQETLLQPQSRVKVQVCKGYQTPRGEHPALTLMVPLLFWLTLLSQSMFPKNMLVCLQQATFLNCGKLSLKYSKGCQYRPLGENPIEAREVIIAVRN